MQSLKISIVLELKAMLWVVSNVLVIKGVVIFQPANSKTILIDNVFDKDYKQSNQVHTPENGRFIQVCSVINYVYQNIITSQVLVFRP